MGQDVKIGKYTLESLTVGMYEDPMIIFREYIQNCVDSIDQAVEKGIMKRDHSKVEIDLKDKSVVIRDNGIGIKKDLGRYVLLDVGNSKKRYNKNRGFRGIGRLAGLSFCENLTFYTSAKGEPYKSALQFNCERLRDLLVPGMFESYDIIDILLNVSSYSTSAEDKDAHYLSVKLDNIHSNHLDLIDESKVMSYLQQVAPVPYDPIHFRFREKIANYTKANEKKIDEYKIFLNGKQVFKNYKDAVPIGLGSRAKKKKITDIRFFENNNLDYWGWYPVFEMAKEIVDQNSSGLRIRKGNIQIGNRNILDVIFDSHEKRFNDWILGEIHVDNSKLIPNAHRDNFETVSKIYREFIESLKPIAKEIEDKVKADSERTKLENEMNKQSKLVRKARNAAKAGFKSRAEKVNLLEDLRFGKDKISRMKTEDEGLKKKVDTLLSDIEKIISQLKNGYIDSIKINKLKRNERKIVHIVFEILENELNKKDYNLVSNKILSNLTGEGK